MVVTVCVVLLLTVCGEAPGLLLQLPRVALAYHGSASRFVGI
jgi:hypothetical protein